LDKKNILITGASGNVGYEVIRRLREINSQNNIIAADYNLLRSKSILSEFPGLEHRSLDFANASTFQEALKGIDIVFLLRPPQLADVPKYFDPFIGAMKAHGIHKIVFLSVQGVESQKMIPHHMLERLIEEHDLEHVFLRPGYFMQNLTTTLLKEIKEENRIYIPSGKLQLNWVDARDIGLVGAHVLDAFDAHSGRAYEITGSEFKGFDEVANMLTEITGKKVDYVSPNLLRFFIHKKRQGIASPMIFVMIMLHWLPRFGKNVPRLTDVVKEITGREPGTIRQFLERKKDIFH
jgi:uncharacterized protein YbjT (DUF2867 family)